MKKIIASVVTAAVIVFSAFSVSAKTATEGDIVDAMSIIAGYDDAGKIAAVAKNTESLDIKAKSYILLDRDSMTVIAESNADAPYAPASITKVMSLLLVFEAIDEGKLDYDTSVTASEHASSMGGSQIWLEPNEKMSVNDLIKAAVVASANDAMTALSEAVAGSEEGFVELMNEKAKSLGLKNTVFKNCSGLDAEGHHSSARDIAIISAELMKHKSITKYSTIWMDTLRDGKTELVNTNKLVRFYSGCTGLKTGTTSTAGCCLSATAERDNLSLVAVVMGADNSNDRFNSARKLLDYGFANYRLLEVTPDLSHLMPPTVKKGETKELPVETETARYLVKKGKAEIEYEFNIKDTVDAPVKKGDTVGNVTVKLGDNKIGTIPIRASESIGKLNFKRVFFKILCSLIGM